MKIDLKVSCFDLIYHFMLTILFLCLEEKEDTPLLHIEDEIEELEKLLPEIKEKLVDMEQIKKDSKEKLKKFKVMFYQFSFFILIKVFRFHAL